MSTRGIEEAEEQIMADENNWMGPRCGQPDECREKGRCLASRHKACFEKMSDIVPTRVVTAVEVYEAECGPIPGRTATPEHQDAQEHLNRVWSARGGYPPAPDPFEGARVEAGAHTEPYEHTRAEGATSLGKPPQEAPEYPSDRWTRHRNAQLRGDDHKWSPDEIASMDKTTPPLQLKRIPTAQEVIEDREAAHGDYRQQAWSAQALKDTMHQHPGWDRLTAPQKETLDMIAVKISRILNGSANVADHWLDIAGYATLVQNLLISGHHLRG